MSFFTISDLSRMNRDDLARTLLCTPPPSLAIIDVRDSDHVGGHILGSTHIPSTTLDYRLPELIRTLKDKQTVVFHCALSQQRGPSAALRYLRERRKFEAYQAESRRTDMGAGGDKEGNGEGWSREQKVAVLDGGFVKWQEKFGEDERLTEAYAKDIWADGYQG